MKYFLAPEIKEKCKAIISKLNFNHVRVDDLECIRSFGSTSNAIARCHGLGKVMQLALKRKAIYVLEFIHERFDRQSEQDQTRTIIHELMHIPKAFGGGFIHHNFVTCRNVDKLYQEYISKC